MLYFVLWYGICNASWKIIFKIAYLSIYKVSSKASSLAPLKYLEVLRTCNWARKYKRIGLKSAVSLSFKNRIKRNKTRRVPLMIHLARPTFTPVAITIYSRSNFVLFCEILKCDEVQTTCAKNSDHNCNDSWSASWINLPRKSLLLS